MDKERSHFASTDYPIMAADTGSPTGTVPFMTPFLIADDPPPPQPIPDVLYPEKTLAERASARFLWAESTRLVNGVFRRKFCLSKDLSINQE